MSELLGGAIIIAIILAAILGPGLAFNALT
jgi:hypothetical protein